MREKQVIHGLNCPGCGGALEIEEGRILVNCPFCGTASLLGGEKGILHFQVRSTVRRTQVLNATRRFFHRWDHDPDLEQEAIIQESFVVYLPYWRVSMQAAAWLFGRQVGEDTDTPIEKAIVQDLVWTGAAYDAGQFGLQELKHVQGRHLEPFDREALGRRALVFEPDRPPARAVKQAEHAFRENARRQAGLTGTRFQHFQFVGRRLSLIHYPLWVVRYTFRGRSYRVVLDGEQVVYGQAPGNPTWRAAILVLTTFAGATLPLDFLMWWSWLVVREPLSFGPDWRLFETGLAGMAYYAAILMVAWLSVVIMLAGYRFFRFGGRRVTALQRNPPLRPFWPTFSWSVGLALCMVLALLVRWQLNVLVPAYVLIACASLGLGCVIRRHAAPRPGGLSPASPLWESPWLGTSQAVETALLGKPRLRPLLCPNCGLPLPAREGKVVYVCHGCGWGLELALAGRALGDAEGLRRVKIVFTARQFHPRLAGTRYLPFWVFDAKVDLNKREAVNKRLLGRERPSPDHGEFWRETRQIYVPAFDTRLENLRAWGTDLTRRQPRFREGKPGQLGDCTLTEAEARELAEMIFLSVEFAKPDVMQEIDYNLTLTAPRLLVIPFEAEWT